MMNRLLVNNLIKLIFLFSSFTVWFALTPYLRFNIVLILLLAGINILFFSALPKLEFPKDALFENILIFILGSIIIFSFGFNIILNPHPKLISNFLGMLIIIVVFYFYYSIAIYTYATKKLIIKWCAYGGVLVMSIAALDGLMANILNIRIHDWFSFGFSGNTSYFDRAIWSAPCSPCVEPAETALFINCLFPFCLYYFKKNKLYILVGLYVFCIFELFSSVGVFTLFSGALLYMFMTQSKIKTLALLILLVLVIAIFVALNYQTISVYLDNLAILDKITLSGNTASDSDRLDAWTRAISDGLQSPLLGNGSGYGKTIRETGYLSTFLLMLGDYGFVAFVVFLLFWASLWRKVLLVRSNFRPYLILSFYAVTIGVAVSDTTNSFIQWLLVPIIFKFYNDNLSTSLLLKAVLKYKILFVLRERIFNAKNLHLAK